MPLNCKIAIIDATMPINYQIASIIALQIYLERALGRTIIAYSALHVASPPARLLYSLLKVAFAHNLA
jgi:hypothetical protein